MQLDLKNFNKPVMLIPDTLIVGGGVAGILTAEELSRRGVPVTLVERDRELGGKVRLSASFFQSGRSPDSWLEEKINGLRKSPQVRIITGSTVAKVQGIAGNFKVALEGAAREELQVGAIVLATGFETTDNLPWQVEGKEEIFVGLLELEQRLAKIPYERPKRFVFLLQEDSYLYGTAGVLKNALRLKEDGHQVFVFYDELKISLDSLEKLYHQCRRAGVKFIRNAAELKLEMVRQVNELHYNDPLLPERLGKTLAVRFDYLVYNEEIIPSPGTEDLQRLLRVNLGPEGFFQEDNFHLNPVHSNRIGIYFVGACRGHDFIPAIAAEASACAAEIAALPGRAQDTASKPYIAYDLCAFCLTCYRSCPRGAIEMDYSHEAAFINPIACEACGICVSECPNRAILYPEPADNVNKQLSQLGGN